MYNISTPHCRALTSAAVTRKIVISKPYAVCKRTLITSRLRSPPFLLPRSPWPSNKSYRHLQIRSRKLRTLVVSQYGAAWKKLTIHLLAFGIVIGLLLAVITALRRVTFRYVRDAGHRRTASIAEWTLLWLGIFLVVAFTFASNLGSLATFLGLVTAGLAVALQNVILAVLGYTVLVGKLGLRLGDQVQISGVTGEVVEFGLLQFQVREVDTQGRPTGRLGSFSNSFIFVSPATGIFKLGMVKRDTNSSDEPLVVGAHSISIDPRTSHV